VLQSLGCSQWCWRVGIFNLGGAFWDAGAQVFINRGVNGRWAETLTSEDVVEYEARAVRELGPECAQWLATGEGL
jgi:aryl sulfotransferase